VAEGSENRGAEATDQKQRENLNGSARGTRTNATLIRPIRHDKQAKCKKELRSAGIKIGLMENSVQSQG
jgi:hypothetical protein